MSTFALHVQGLTLDGGMLVDLCRADILKDEGGGSPSML